MAHSYSTPANTAGYDVAVAALNTELVSFKRERYETLNPQTSSYTLVLSDANDVQVQMNNGSANTLTVPPNVDVAFPIGTVIPVLNLGAGQTTLTAGAGVTINKAAGTLKMTAQWSVATLRKIATNTWVASGDLAAS